jgi:hypothetical protein
MLHALHCNNTFRLVHWQIMHPGEFCGSLKMSVYY